MFRVDFVLGMRFGKCVLPKGLAKESPKNMKIQTYWDLLGYTMVLTTPHANSMQKTLQMQKTYP